MKSPGRKVRAFLFADAEVGEDVAEDVVGMDCTCDFSKVVQGLAGVHGDKVARHVVGQPLTHRLKRCVGSRQRLKMPEVGDDQLVSLVVGLVLGGEKFLESVNALSMGRAHVKYGMVPIGVCGCGEVAFVPNHNEVAVWMQLHVGQLVNSFNVAVCGGV